MSQYISPKKSLGQHFLMDPNIARKIAASLTGHGGYKYVLEIGPGTGMLSKYLMQHEDYQWTGLDVDREAIACLKKAYPEEEDRIIAGDFLRYDLHGLFGSEAFAVIGNFPYNISSQIIIRVLNFRKQIPEVVGMFQKELALRIAAPPGSKTYGILSVLTRAFYDVKVLFHVDPHVFMPPPKVQSTVIRLIRKKSFVLECDESLFFTVVRTAFNQRRKTLRNSLKGMPVQWDKIPGHFIKERPEQLDVHDFVQIAGNIRAGKA